MTARDHIVEIIEGKRSSFFLEATLSFLSTLYQAAISIRHLAYDKNFFKSKKAPSCYVISVGNIAVGGTGKTPFVQMLAQELLSFTRPSILSRGYRSAVERSGKSLKVGSTHDAQLVGDEPLLLSRLLPEISIWVGRDRLRSAQFAVAEGSKLLILDDGLQHRKLHRDLEIIILNGESPLGNNRFLPRGNLRDLPQRLEKADLIVLHPYSEKGAAEIKKWSNAPIIGVTRTFNTPIPNKVALFCGIGNPDQFIRMVEETSEILSILRLPDHFAPDLDELASFAKTAKLRGAEALVCTEKDAVKLPSDIKLDLPIFPIPAKLSVDFGQKEWEALIYKIKESINERSI